MRVFGKRVLTVLLACLLAAGAGGCGLAEKLPGGGSVQTPPVTPAPVTQFSHEPAPFASLVYERPDTDAVGRQIDALFDGIEAGKPADELLADYATVRAAYDAASSMMDLAYLLYALDVTVDTYQTEYSRLESLLSALDLRLTDVSIALFETSDSSQAQAREALGDAYVDAVYEGEALNSEEIQTLLEQERALVNEYDRLGVTFSIEDGGRTWTYDEIAGDDALSVDEYYRIFDAYCNAFNQEAGALFCRLLSVRDGIAKALGYGSYAAYMYDCYGRDYTLEDAKTLHAAVKTYIVPLYQKALLAPTDGASLLGVLEGLLAGLKGALSETDGQAGGRGAISQTQFLSQLQEAAAGFSPLLAEPLAYMLQNKLYDFSANPKKMDANFTTYIAACKAPYMMTSWENDGYSASTIIHELGHYANYYHNPMVGWGLSDSLDLAEVDSQALELLMMGSYDTFFGERADAERSERLLDCLYALISGCMEDEFQQIAYANPAMTLPELNAAYGRLLDEYGMSELYEYTGTEWALIPHTFQSPLYYISYAASMVPALELWVLSRSDFDAARNAYFAIMNRAPYKPFGEVLADNGLADVFSAETVRVISKAAASALEENHGR